MNTSKVKHTLGFIAVVAAVAAAAYYGGQRMQPKEAERFVSGNGRIEATEINVSSKYAGRIQEVLVREGDFVAAGQPLVRMQIETLEAQRAEAEAQRQRALTNVESAKARVAMRESDVAAARAGITRAESDLDAAQRRLARSEALAKEGAASAQELDDDRARVRSNEAAVHLAKAQAVAAQAAVEAAKAEVTGAGADVKAAAATLARIDAEIKDSVLVSPRPARVQYRIAQEGEVLAAGAAVLNLIDLGDVYMTFFVPSDVAGRVALGSDVRIVLDAAPQYPAPAKVSFVASSAQFTPKTVETASERQKLMFRVRAQIDPELLQKHVDYVKTGLPGVAWVKLDPAAAWPAELDTKVLPQ
jgi:HlyD family secretion protein